MKKRKSSLEKQPNLLVSRTTRMTGSHKFRRKQKSPLSKQNKLTKTKSMMDSNKSKRKRKLLLNKKNNLKRSNQPK